MAQLARTIRIPVLLLGECPGYYQIFCSGCVADSMFTWGGHFKISVLQSCWCLALGCLSDICKRKKPWVLGGLFILVDLLLPDWQLGWGSVGAIHRLLPAGWRETDPSCWHSWETSLCAPAKGGETNFPFSNPRMVGCRLGFFLPRCWCLWAGVTYFLHIYIFFSAIIYVCVYMCMSSMLL